MLSPLLFRTFVRPMGIEAKKEKKKKRKERKGRKKEKKEKKEKRKEKKKRKREPPCVSGWLWVALADLGKVVLTPCFSLGATPWGSGPQQALGGKLHSAGGV